MTKGPDDDNEDPPGGRAAERLKQFEQARKPKGSDSKATPAPSQDDDQATKEKR